MTQHKIRRLGCSVGFILSALAVHSTAFAQATYNFAGLSWGDNIDKVDSKLQSTGFSGCGMRLKLQCKITEQCTCEFSGQSVLNGYATFTRNGLTAVSIYTYDDPVATLRKKYGPPLPARPVKQSSDSHISLAEIDEITTSRWQSPSGDTIEMHSAGDKKEVTYRSASINRSEVQKKTKADSMY